MPSINVFVWIMLALGAYWCFIRPHGYIAAFFYGVAYAGLLVLALMLYKL